MDMRRFAVATTVTLLLALADSSAAGTLSRSTSHKRPVKTVTITQASKQVAARSAGSCAQCNADASRRSKTRSLKKASATANKLPCHPKDYVDPKIARNYNAALRDIKRAGIKPKINSVWRSSADQAQLRKCSLSARCRGANPGLYRALPPGKSLHEAGFAVDIGGVAAGPRGDKQLTPQGRRIVGIMRKHGFAWRYGLSDPAHFEADPRKFGYRSTQHAIARTQTTCQFRLAKNKVQKKASSRVAVVRTRNSPQPKAVATATKLHRHPTRIRA